MTETKNDRGEEGTDRGLRLIPQVASCIIYIYKIHLVGILDIS